MPERKLSDWICTDERIDRLSAFEEAFFYRLLTKADGKGRVDARPQVLKSAVYPLKKVTLKDVEKPPANSCTSDLPASTKRRGARFCV